MQVSLQLKNEERRGRRKAGKMWKVDSTRGKREELVARCIAICDVTSAVIAFSNFRSQRKIALGFLAGMTQSGLKSN